MLQKGGSPTNMAAGQAKQLLGRLVKKIKKKKKSLQLQVTLFKKAQFLQEALELSTKGEFNLKTQSDKQKRKFPHAGLLQTWRTPTNLKEL